MGSLRLALRGLRTPFELSSPAARSLLCVLTWSEVADAHTGGANHPVRCLQVHLPKHIAAVSVSNTAEIPRPIYIAAVGAAEFRQVLAKREG